MEVIAKSGDLLTFQLRVVVDYDSVWYFKSTDDVFPQKLFYTSLCNAGDNLCFYLFCEVFVGHNYKLLLGLGQ